MSPTDAGKRRAGSDALELHGVSIVGRAGRRPVPPRYPTRATRCHRGLRRCRTPAWHPPRPPGNTPLADAVVEIWQCDALGRYSGFPPPDSSVVVTAATAPRAEYLADQTFLRGRQRPTTPAWSSSARSIPAGIPAAPCTYTSWSTPTCMMLTSQLYFPDQTSDQVLAQAPYATRPGRDTTNDTDEIFATGGDPAVLDIVPTARGIGPPSASNCPTLRMIPDKPRRCLQLTPEPPAGWLRPPWLMKLAAYLAGDQPERWRQPSGRGSEVSWAGCVASVRSRQAR